MADGTIQVLIVDDVAETRHNIRKLLEFEADICVVGEAADGREALALAKELQPDCVLMDINMPGLDGISATERIYQVLPTACRLSSASRANRNTCGKLCWPAPETTWSNPSAARSW